MNPSQQRMLEYFKVHQIASAVEVSRAMNLTAANVHHHMNSLIHVGLIEHAGERPQGGRGRPVKLYRLGVLQRGDNLDCLCSNLLSTWVTPKTESGSSTHMQVLAGFMLKDAITTRPESAQSRISSALAWLTNHHYQARWEAHTEGPQIILGSCPYARIIESHPELCRLDECLLGILLERRITQAGKLVRTTQGATVCLFT